MDSRHDLRSRLEALNRARLQGKICSADQIRIPDADRRTAPPPLREVAPGRVVTNPAGSFYRITARASQLGHQGLALSQQYPQTLRAGSAGGHPGHLDILATTSLGRALYMDLETCGFAGNPLFLVGLMWWYRADFRVVQLFARNYAEERAVIDQTATILADKSTLVTFNGKSFDWPMLRERAMAHRVQMPEHMEHCDLLHESRRAWPGLSDHRLTTLETVLCRRRRTGDIDGSQIPEAYHNFVHTGDARLIGSIIRHNLWDLLTLAELAMIALTGTSAPH
jgi:uncharacterized protein YprB with RNaseH-like and TPR domain